MAPSRCNMAWKDSRRLAPCPGVLAAPSKANHNIHLLDKRTRFVDICSSRALLVRYSKRARDVNDMSGETGASTKLPRYRCGRVAPTELSNWFPSERRPLPVFPAVFSAASMVASGSSRDSGASSSGMAP